jgi:hypothetical protein
LFALFILAGTLSGCGAVTAATLGTIAGAATSAAQAGEEVFALGKLDTAEMASMESAVTAVRGAASDLSLHVKCDPCHRKKDATVEDFLFVDDKGKEIAIRVDAHSPTLSQIRIDVGVFGSEVTAHLFLTRLRAHLPAERNAATRPSSRSAA